MSAFVIELFTGAVRWGTTIGLLVIVLGVLGVWFLGRGGRFLVPASWFKRALSALILVLMLGACAGLVMLHGPLEPVVALVHGLDDRLGEPMLNVEFQTVADGSTRTLEDYRGKVVLLNVWATWCPPCVEEMPTLNQLYERHRDDGLVVITLSDEPRESLLDFAATRELSTETGYVDSLDWLTSEDIRPITMIIDREGILQHHLLGARDLQSFEELVNRHL